MLMQYWLPPDSYGSNCHCMVAVQFGRAWMHILLFLLIWNDHQIWTPCPRIFAARMFQLECGFLGSCLSNVNTPKRRLTCLCRQRWQH